MISPKGMKVKTLCLNLAIHMREIDERISPSLYRELRPGEQDRPPSVDDFNLLWDTILDEAAAAGYDLGPMIGGKA